MQHQQDIRPPFPATLIAIGSGLQVCDQPFVKFNTTEQTNEEVFML